MKKPLFALLVIFAAISSCKKSVVGPPVTTIKYMSYTSNSTWNYELHDNLTSLTTSYILTATDGDTTIDKKSYHIFTHSNAGNEYYLLSGSDYYSFQNLPATLSGALFENIYLKNNAAVNNTWSQSYNVTTSGVPLTITITNAIAEKSISKTVSGIPYTDVIHITSTLAVSAFGVPLPAGAVTAEIQNFYAPKFGLIESDNKININYSGLVSNTDQQTILKSADIK